MFKKRISGIGPFYTDDYEFRVIKIALAEYNHGFDVYYDHGCDTAVYKDRVKFYVDGKGSGNDTHTIKSLTTGKVFTEKKDKYNAAGRLISIIVTANFELVDNSQNGFKQLIFIEDDISEKIDKLGL